MVAGFGQALIFLTLLMAEVILGLFVVCYAGHCFLVVMQDTAAGNDEVTWPDEPLQDWLLGGVYLVGMLLIWLVPVGIVRAMMISNGIAGDYLLPLLTGGAVLLWLLFPISLLSSLSGSSRLFLLRIAVIRQLARIPGALLVLYLVSGMLFAGWLGLGYLTFLHGWWPVLPAMAVVGPVALLLYARLLGRIAWKLDQLKPIKRKSRQEPKPVPGIKIEAQDPWAEPPRKRKKKKKPAKSSKGSPSDESYGLAEDPPTRQPSETPLDGYPAIGAETFAVEDAPDVPDSEKADLHGRSVSVGDKEEEKLATPSKPTPPPERPLLDGVYGFPWYASNRKVLLFLALGGFFMGAIVLSMRLPGQ